MGSFLNGKHTLILNSEHCRVSVGFENSPVESATVMQWVDFVFCFFDFMIYTAELFTRCGRGQVYVVEITNSIKHLQMTLFLLSLRCKSWEDLRLDERPVHSRKQHLVFFCLPLLTLSLRSKRMNAQSCALSPTKLRKILALEKKPLGEKGSVILVFRKNTDLLLK